MQGQGLRRKLRGLLRTGVLAVVLASAAGWALGSTWPGVASAHAGPGVPFRPTTTLVHTSALRRAEAGRPLPIPVLHLRGNKAALLSGRMIDPPLARPVSVLAHPEGARVRRPRRAVKAVVRRHPDGARTARAARRSVLATMTVLATAYWPDPAWSTGYTATGWKAQYGIVAVDPSVIPLGTRMYVPGYGQAIAEDTGGAIIGDHIDLCYNDRQQAVDWGAQTVRIRIEHWG